MRNVSIDVLRCLKIIENPYMQGEGNIYKTYLNTNEELEKVFKITNVKDKNVLCVQASSDQLFKCLESGAKNIDTFDINYLSKYYYYLKKNYLLLFNKMLDIKVTKEELYETLSTFDLNNPDEIESYTFWSELLKFVNINHFLELFYIYPKYQNYNLKELVPKVKNFKLNFNEINMFENKFNTDKKYDVVIMSNIMESIGTLSKSNKLLERITNKNAEIICSNVAFFNVNEHSIFERASMEDKFIYDEGIYEYDNIVGIEHQIAYKYIRK